MKRTVLQGLLAAVVSLDAATVCWPACHQGDYSGNVRYTCNLAGTSKSYTPDPVSNCGYSILYCYGCRLNTYPNQERDQAWSVSTCSGTLLSDTGWFPITPTPLEDDLAYTCCS